MKVLVVGNGGREHAMAWKLAQSPRVTEVLVAPGNAGTATEPRCRNVAVAADDVKGLLALARNEGVGFTVVGPEVPLSLGIVDTFTDAKQRIFGPRAKAAQLESSKAFAKDFLERHGIPTARYRVFNDLQSALDDVAARGAPIVIKADGLAAGKGVVVATSVGEAQAALRDMFGGSLGNAGARVVIEDFLEGEEASFIVVVAGGHAVELATSQDHKRVGDGDSGPNTGGMGAYSPAPVVTEAVRRRVLAEVIGPTLRGLDADGIEFTGFLYAGLMITTDGAPRVLEFNCRLGDPETQPLLMRLDSDLLELLEAAVDGRLDSMTPRWKPQAALGVVMAAEGYPGTIRKGDPIEGIAQADAAGVKVFHAGTALDGGRAVTAGGRVLCVVGLGDDVAAAQKRAYAGVARIRWAGEHHRSDIGARAIGRG